MWGAPNNRMADHMVRRGAAPTSERQRWHRPPSRIQLGAAALRAGSQWPPHIATARPHATGAAWPPTATRQKPPLPCLHRRASTADHPIISERTSHMLPARPPGVAIPGTMQPAPRSHQPARRRWRRRHQPCMLAIVALLAHNLNAPCARQRGATPVCAHRRCDATSGAKRMPRHPTRIQLA